MMRKILFLTPQLPYPPISGGLIKSWKMVEFMSKNYCLGIGCFLKGEDGRFLNEFKNRVNLYEFFHTSVNKKRTINNYVASILKNKPIAIYRNYSPYFRTTVLRKINNYDLILVDHYTMYQYVPKDFKGKTILHQHNAEYVIWQRLSKNKDYPIPVRMASMFEKKRVACYEKHICNLADKVLCVSSNDIENLVRLGVNSQKLELVMTVGDDTLLNLPDLAFEKTHESILFIGTLSWEPNINGLIWFIERCWGGLKKLFPELKFYIIGKNPDIKLVNLCKKYKDIILTGFVEDLEEYYSNCRIFINPLRVGSGIKVKSINAMYRGIPLVTSYIGVEGLDVEDNIHVAIANTEQEYIEKIAILLRNKNLWYTLSKNSRDLVNNRYTWNKSLEKLKMVIEGGLKEQ